MSLFDKENTHDTSDSTAGNLCASRQPLPEGRGSQSPAGHHRPYALVIIKLIHSVVWVFFVGCILAIPTAAAKGEFGWAAMCSGAVLIECGILACNCGRCPLTDLARRYTDERRENFDIYLPLWLARKNKAIFGTLFVLSEVYLLARWVAFRH